MTPYLILGSTSGLEIEALMSLPAHDCAPDFYKGIQRLKVRPYYLDITF